MNAKVRLDPITGKPSTSASQGMDAACFLGSAQTDTTMEQRALRGDYALVYVTPEKIKVWLENGSLDTLARNTKLVCFAIDEAHCVSQWGHNFRPDYRLLSNLRKGGGELSSSTTTSGNFANIPIVALTASATPLVEKDIVTNLKLSDRGTVRISGTFNRPNLQYRIERRGGKMDLEIRRLQNIIAEAGEGSTIIYAASRSAVEGLSEKLAQRGVPNKYYHAGMSPGERSVVHLDFTTDKVKVIVATVAFGMGIDKEDVSVVVAEGRE